VQSRQIANENKCVTCSDRL